MPNIQDVHVDTPLTNIAVNYQFEEGIAEQVFPVVPVSKESDVYYVMGREELKIPQLLRAAGARSAEFRWDVTNSNFRAEEYALHFPLPDRVRDIADTPIRARATSVEKLTRVIKTAQESRVAAICQNAGNFVGATSVPNPKWDAANCIPEQDVDLAVLSVRRRAGVNPNSLVTSDPVARALRRWLATQAGGLSLQDKLKLVDLPDPIFNLHPIVAKAVYDSAADGVAASIADVWTDDCLICHITKNPSLTTISLCYQLLARPFIVKACREEGRAADFLEPGHIQDEVLLASACGYLFTDVLT